MASADKADRRIVHCLICQKPQDLLSTHLARVCMKTSTPEERQAELQRAKVSMKEWTKQARNWDYDDMVQRYPHRPTRLALLEDLQRRNFFVANAPNPADLEPRDEPPAAAAAPSVTPAAAVADATGESLPSVSGTAAGSEETSSKEAGARDPTWQQPQAPAITTVRMNMQTMGLSEKFPSVTTMLAGFKKYLTETFQVPNCQQKVDNVSRMLRYIQPEGHGVSTGFLVKSIETRDFLHNLKLSKMEPATILNYIKNMIQFVQYLKTCLNFAAVDPDFHRKCQAYIDFLCMLRKPVSKALCMATWQVRSSPDEMPDEGTYWGQKRQREENSVLDFTAFLCSFPVSLNGQPPIRKYRVAAGFSADRVFYYNWKAVQYGLRKEHLLSKCYRRQPTAEMVEAFIEQEDWDPNCPTPEDIVAKWRPATQTKVESDLAIMRMVRRH